MLTLFFQISPPVHPLSPYNPLSKVRMRPLCDNGNYCVVCVLLLCVMMTSIERCCARRRRPPVAYPLFRQKHHHLGHSAVSDFLVSPSIVTEEETLKKTSCLLSDNLVLKDAQECTSYDDDNANTSQDDELRTIGNSILRCIVSSTLETNEHTLIAQDDDRSPAAAKIMNPFGRALINRSAEKAIFAFPRHHIMPGAPTRFHSEQSTRWSVLNTALSLSGGASKEPKKSSSGKKKKKKSKSRSSSPTSSSKQKSKSSSFSKPTKNGSKKQKPIKSKASSHLKTRLKSTNPNYRIQRELKSFIQDPPPGLTVAVGKNMRIWIVTVAGPGIYDGETFRLRVSFPPQYPTVPPSVYFLPPNIPVHEHVYTNGDICLSLLGKDWRPTMTAQSIAVSILSILASAQSKSLPMDNARHAQNKPGEYQKGM